MNDLKQERELERLAARYAEQTDDELLDLQDRRADLTGTALQALDRTMQQRHLTPRPAPAPTRVDPAQESTEAGEDEVFVYHFRDSLSAVTAANILRFADISHRMAVHPNPGSGQGALGGATVTLFVDREDENDTRGILQSKMHLFLEHAEHDADVEIDGPGVLGEFTRQQAAIVTRALEEHGIPFESSEGDRDGAPILLSVAGDRLEEAFAVVEAIADELPPDPEV